MGHTEEPEEPAATRQAGFAARTGRERDARLQHRLETLHHQRAVLLEALLGKPDPVYADLFSGEVDHQRLFDALPLPDLSIDCRNDTAFDLPRVFNVVCKRRDAFNFFLRLFENRDTPDRLCEALVYVGFKAISLKYEREEVFLLLRLKTEDGAFRVRDEELRLVLNPLFRDRRVVLEGELLERFVWLFRDSQRLRNRAMTMEWQLDPSRRSLVLVPPGSCDRDEAIGSFRLFLLSAPRKSDRGGLHDPLVALLQGQTVRIPRALEAEFMGALKSWVLLLKLCRGRRRLRDPASGDLLMAVAEEASAPPSGN